MSCNGQKSRQAKAACHAFRSPSPATSLRSAIFTRATPPSRLFRGWGAVPSKKKLRTTGDLERDGSTQPPEARSQALGHLAQPQNNSDGRLDPTLAFPPRLCIIASMGTKVKPDPPDNPGVDCPTCQPDPWDPGLLPATLRAVIHDVFACVGYPDPPNDHIIEIDQTSRWPCRFDKTLEIDGVTWTYAFDLSISRLEVITPYPLPAWAFAGDLSPCEGFPFANFLSCPGNAGEGGTGFVLDLPSTNVLTLAHTLNFTPLPGSFSEEYSAADPDQVVVRIAQPPFPSSCLFLYEPP